MAVSDEAIPLHDIIKELHRVAREISKEVWIDQDAQDWYVSGIKDSAHLIMLKWKE